MINLNEFPLPYRLDRNRNGDVSITSVAGDRLMLSGTDNYGSPAQALADKIAAMNDEDFIAEAEQRIWLAAYASNNPRSDYHWQASACYYEAMRRDNPALYQRAYDQARRSAGL